MNNSLLTANGTLSFTNTGEPVRLDTFLANQLSGYSRTFLKNIIQTHTITINGKPVNKPSTLLKIGDTIVVTLNNQEAQTKEAVHSHDFNVEIIFIHEHFLIINKPAGLTVHESETMTSGEPTLVDWISNNYSEIMHIGAIDRPGIVHRLDKDTSGIMVIARTNYAHQQFTKMFQERTISKTYLALVEGHPTQEGTIDLPIGRHPTQRHKMHAFKKHERKSGTLREAMTHFQTVTYFNDTALVKAKPVTGRTHQIRVHLTALGHPLVGDSVYGKKSQLIERHALHAHEIAFTFDGTAYHFTAPLAPDFNQALEKSIVLSNNQESFHYKD